MKMLHSFNRTSLMVGLVMLSMTASMAVIKVELNGKLLSFGVPPTQIHGSTMVPLRGIFEALGAEVRWDGPTQTITANKGTTNVQLGIGSTNATVNTRTVVLDNPAMVLNGNTMVPLRFVSEALGANVKWNGAAQLVVISTEQQDTTSISLPSNAVIPVELDKKLSSATSKKGDAVTATVRSTKNGDAEFPLGTKLCGIVSEVQPKATDKPGVLALSFQQALLPDGQKVPLTGSMVSLDEKSVTQSADGHLIANDKKTSDTLLFTAVGTGAGLVVGKLVGKDLITSGLIGAAAGYLYSTTTKDGTKTADVIVDKGTEFGVRLDQVLSFNTSTSFVAARTAYLQSRTTTNQTK